MTTTEIQDRIEKIENLSHDPECAHSAEDALYVDFIKYVESLGIPELSDKAKQVLTVDAMPFTRWYA